MTSIGIIAINEAERLGYAADMAACLTMEALKGIISAFDVDLLAVRPHAEIAAVGGRIRKWLEGSRRLTNKEKYVCKMLIRCAVYHKFMELRGSVLIC